MNKNEVKRLGQLENKVTALVIHVTDTAKATEKLVTNDMPHLQKEVSRNTGKLTVIIPLIISVLVAVLGLIGINVWG